MGLLTPIAIRLGGQPWMPRLNRQIVALDKAIHRVTSGRWSILDIAGLPNLMLTVRGRKTGIRRNVPLLCVPTDEGILIAGSFWGGPAEPAWVANVEAIEARSQTVTVTRRGKRGPYAVRQLHDAERDSAWQTMIGTWPNYATYEKRTERTIKVFLLTPVSDANA